MVLDGLLAQGHSDRTQLRGVSAANLGLSVALHVHSAGVADAAVGGSLLSAAELESSKQYLQLDSGEWRIAHLVRKLTCSDSKSVSASHCSGHPSSHIPHPSSSLFACNDSQLPVADGVLEATAVAVRVQWDQAQADAHAAQDAAACDAGAGTAGAAVSLADAAAVFAVGTRLWKEDSGRLPSRSPSQVCVIFRMQHSVLG